MSTIQLTPHFKLSEFEKSSTARARGINNSVPANLIPNIKNLCEQVLEPLRQHVGKPVVIGSGYRCPTLNKAVGGVSNSQHMTGEAADIHLNSIEEGKQWLTWIMDNCTFDQLIWERESKTSNHYWIHVSCKRDITKNRHQVKSIVKYK